MKGQVTSIVFWLLCTLNNSHIVPNSQFSFPVRSSDSFTKSKSLSVTNIPMTKWVCSVRYRFHLKGCRPWKRSTIQTVIPNLCQHTCIYLRKGTSCDLVTPFQSMILLETGGVSCAYYLDYDHHRIGPASWELDSLKQPIKRLCNHTKEKRSYWLTSWSVLPYCAFCAFLRRSLSKCHFRVA